MNDNAGFASNALAEQEVVDAVGAGKINSALVIYYNSGTSKVEAFIDANIGADANGGDTVISDLDDGNGIANGTELAGALAVGDFEFI